MNDERSHTRERSGDEPDELPRRVTAAPEQLLTGLAIGLPTLEVYCVACDATLTEGQMIVIYGYRSAESVTEVLARARLGTVSRSAVQSHRLCLTEVALEAYSSPREGTPP